VNPNQYALNPTGTKRVLFNTKLPLFNLTKFEFVLLEFGVGLGVVFGVDLGVELGVGLGVGFGVGLGVVFAGGFSVGLGVVFGLFRL